MSNFPVWKFWRVHAIQAILRATADQKSGGKAVTYLIPSYSLFEQLWSSLRADRNKIFIYIGISSVRTNVLAHVRWPPR